LFDYETARHAVYIAAAVVVAYFALISLKALLKKHEAQFGMKIHIKFAYNIICVFIILLAVAVIGSQFNGFSKAVNTILASSGIIALGLSLAAQESLTNIIDGLFISMFKPFNIGDRITLPEKNNLTGVVKEMNLRHTIINTYQNTSYIIPNSVMSSAIIDNSNFRNTHFAYPIDVSVSYDSDLEKAIKVLEEAVCSVPEFVDNRTEEQIAAGAPRTSALVREFGDSGIVLRCFMYTPSVSESFAACSKARIAIKKAFDENGITIPFTTIHIDK